MGRKQRGRRNANSVKYRKKMARKAAKRDIAREYGLEALRERLRAEERNSNGNGFLNMMADLAEKMKGQDEDEPGSR